MVHLECVVSQELFLVSINDVETTIYTHTHKNEL